MASLFAGRALDSVKRSGFTDESRRYRWTGRRFICNAYAATEAGRAIG